MSGSAAKMKPYVLIVGEGIHDVAAVVKILKLRGFQELEYLHDLPQLFQLMIPSKYPSEQDDRLRHIVSHPSFLESDKGYVVAHNAGGKDKLAGALYRLIGSMRTPYPCAVALLADTDNKDCSQRTDEIQKQLADYFKEQEVDEKDIAVNSFKDGHIDFDEEEVPAFRYLFPDCRQQGTLERLLLDGADRSYPKLRVEADKYISAVKDISRTDTKEKYRFSSFDGDKATVGVMVNVLKPGRPNQASIFDDKWFTNDTLRNLELHKQFSDFLSKVLDTFQHHS